MYSSRVSHAGATAVTVDPAPCVRGRLRVPGDKSISHRYALLAALAEGASTIRNYAPGADCAVTLRCLRTLGVDARSGPGPDGEPAAVTVVGRGPAGLRAPSNALDAANSGTTMRLLAGVLAARPFDSEITGDDSLRRRPMQRIVDPAGADGRLHPHGGGPAAAHHPRTARCAASRTTCRWPAPR